MKSRLLYLAIGLTSFSQAAVVAGYNLETFDRPDTIITFNGSPAASGIAAVGFFNMTATQVNDAVSLALTNFNFTTLVNNFVIAGSGVLGNRNIIDNTTLGLYDVGGSVNSPLDTQNPLVPNAPLGAILYTFIGNGTTLGLSTHVALLRSPEVIADPLNGVPDNNTLFPSTSTVLIGTPSNNLDYNFGLGVVQTNAIALVGVPEPSTAILGAIGALALLRRRR